MITVTRKTRFSAAHHFYLTQYSKQENEERFGLLANRHGHGHNYVLEAAVEGIIDPATGMVVNLTELKRILRQHVGRQLDFQHINYVMPYFKTHLPTLENLVRYFWDDIAQELDEQGLNLAWLRLYESDDLYVRYDGSKDMLYLTRRYEFSASHRLYNPEFSDRQNAEIFGKCNNPNGHGHNYELEVTLCGRPAEDETGMLIDLMQWDEIVQQQVLDSVDHKDLNRDVPFLKEVIPTAENIVVQLWKQLDGQFPKPAQLYKLRLMETRKNYAEYKGEPA